MILPALLDLAAVLVFAVTGALVAARAQLDPVGFVFVACLTAVGGGTIRDLLLGREPVFWIEDPLPVAVAGAAATAVFFTHHLLASRLMVLIWLDAIALSIAVAAGVGVAHGLGHPVWVQLVMGVVTGCFGGLMRDVVVGEVPLVLRQGELYVTAALAGGLAAVLTRDLVGPGPLTQSACVSMTFILRAGSIRYGWRLPSFRARPPKP
ncbi:trimeric intracellular cation channel family protein [Jannaschia sp. S6380]|uniref:trimeric intracellular cation channel family protein n=1 Tax=Jannaschia sp. S6380 TaxID=2926408 RepID=UPI001FF24E09|nr:trimeric intracellular cation channel family protein [Jannaschia sp. S6380]MCK0169376.1 trimeric intracellular cation channel family protein [Jannaschia sp. S6380]